MKKDKNFEENFLKFQQFLLVECISLKTLESLNYQHWKNKRNTKH
jgi:hypothetical protein